MKTTRHFTASVMARRPALSMVWGESALANPLRTKAQANRRIRCCALVPDMGEYLRVAPEPDRKTVHNDSFDRGFKP
jgi:hypothetical protein